MSVKKGLPALFIIGVISCLLFIINGTEHVKATTTLTKEDRDFISYNYVISIHELKISDEYYTAVLKRDGVYLIDREGDVFKHIRYPNTLTKIVESELTPTALNDTGVLGKRTLDIRLTQIGDIDEGGQNDLLFDVRSRTNKKSNYLIAYSYEMNEPIWEYQPKMKSTKSCGFRTFCEEPVEIMKVKLREDSLYVAAGYNFTKLNMNTGEPVKNFTYTNNVWSFDFISDVNADGSSDFVISVQPSKVLSIDGDTFQIINQLNVATDLILSDFITLKLNVTELAFLPTRNIVVAASEDGMIYELDLVNNRIISEKRMYTKEDLASYYPDIRRDTQRDEFEYYRSETIDYFILGDNSPVEFNIHTLGSIDYDEIEDYIVEWKWKQNRNGEFNSKASTEDKLNHFRVEQSGESSPLIFEQSTFRAIYNKSIFYTTSEYLEAFHLPSYEYLLERNFPVRTNSTVIFNQNGMVIKDRSQQITYYDMQNYPKIFAKWRFNELDQMNTTKEVVASPHYFLSIERPERGRYSSSETDKVKLYTKHGSLISEYETRPHEVISYTHLSENQYYLIEFASDATLSKSIFDSKTGELLEKSRINIQVDLDDEIDEYLLKSNRLEALNYKDVNDDGIDEVLFIKQSYNFRDSILLTTYVIYDIANDILIDHYYDYKSDYIWPEYFFIEKDVNHDPNPEIVSYYFSKYNTLELNALYSKGEDLLSETQVMHKSFNIPKAVYQPALEVDLNNDGYKEIIINMSNIENTNNRGAFILDYKQNNLIKLTDDFNESYQIEDLDGDGVNEIVIVQHHNSELAVYIYNYQFGKIELKSIIPIGDDRAADKSDLYGLFDYNNDGVKDVVFSVFDREQHMKTQVVDYETNQILKEQTYDLRSQGSGDVSLGEHVYALKTEVKRVNNRLYIMTSLPLSGEVDFNKRETLFDQSEMVLANTDTLSLDYHLGNYQKMLKSNQIFEMSDEAILMNDMIGIKDVEKDFSGLYKNNYHFNIDSDVDIREVKVLIHDQLYNTNANISYNQDEFDLSLAAGEYNLSFYIYTEDGAVFLYTDEVYISKTQSNSLIHQGIVFTLFSIVFITSSIKINKFLHS